MKFALNDIQKGFTVKPHKSALDNSETRLSRQFYNFTRSSRQNTVMLTWREKMPAG